MYKIFPVFFAVVTVVGVVVCACAVIEPPVPKITDATVKIFQGTRR